MDTRVDIKETANSNDKDGIFYRSFLEVGGNTHSWTRPQADISFAVSELSRFVFNRGKPHLEASKRVFRYLKKTLTLGLVHRSSSSKMPPNTLWSYVDSDWAVCPDSGRSTSGFVFMLNGAAISWQFKHQLTFAQPKRSFSASAMVQEVIYLRKSLANLGYPQTEPTPVFADNETCIAWSEGSPSL